MTSKNITQLGSQSNHIANNTNNNNNNNNNSKYIDINIAKDFTQSNSASDGPIIDDNPHDRHRRLQQQQQQHNNSNINKLWNYYKQCDDDSTKVKCRLCSVRLCNRPTTATLWNHLKIKHSISKIDIVDNNRTPIQPRPVPLSNGNSVERLSDQSANDINIINKRNHQENNNINNPINEPIKSNINMTRTHYQNQQQPPYHHYGGKSKGNPHTKMTPSSSSPTKATITAASNTTNTTSSSQISLRRNLDLIDYNELSLVTSMKPSPSSSLSKNFMSRLNLLSSPVTRKLKFWNKKSFQVNQYDPSFKVIYLGNLGMQFWSKDESCLEKPLSTLWNNYLVNMKTEIVMRLTICNSGLKAITRQHGLTQYWSNRLVYCCSHKNYPKIFAWIYRHEGKKMRQELRCHAVFCSSPEKASKMVSLLSQRLACALQEFRREKKSCGPSLVTNNNNISVQQTLPRKIPLRRQILAKGSANFRPPLERSKSAPKLSSIMEDDYDLEDEEEEDGDEEDENEDEEGDYEYSQEEYEFGQSFDDRDDDDDDDNDDDDEGLVKEAENYEEEDEGEYCSTHKIDATSLSTTANEETSNSSSVYATGDISYCSKQDAPSNRDRFDGILGEDLLDAAVDDLRSPPHSMTPEPGQEVHSNSNSLLSRSGSKRRKERSHSGSAGSRCNELKSHSLNCHKDQNQETEQQQQQQLLLLHILDQSNSSANNIISQTTTSSLIKTKDVNNDKHDILSNQEKDSIETVNPSNVEHENGAKNNSITKSVNDITGGDMIQTVPSPSPTTTTTTTTRTGQTDDKDMSQQDIILSWSNNLVIK